jgi:hypothetical protein
MQLFAPAGVSKEYNIDAMALLDLFGKKKKEFKASCRITREPLGILRDERRGSRSVQRRSERTIWEILLPTGTTRGKSG